MSVCAVLQRYEEVSVCERGRDMWSEMELFIRENSSSRVEQSVCGGWGREREGGRPAYLFVFFASILFVVRCVVHLSDVQ